MTNPTLSPRSERLMPNTFRLWVMGCPHVLRDLYERAIPEPQYRRHDGRESLGDPIRQSESPDGFDWDAAIVLGDFSSEQGVPTDREGAEVVRQFGRLERHRRV
jgi:hypothetical protein